MQKARSLGLDTVVGLVAALLVAAAIGPIATLTTATAITIPNCTDGDRYAVVSGNSYRLINCMASNVTFFSTIASTQLRHVAIVVEGGASFPAFRFPEEAGNGSTAPAFQLERMFNVSIRFVDVVAFAPALAVPVWLSAADLSHVAVELHRVQLTSSTECLVRYRSTVFGQWLALNVTDSVVHTDPSFLDVIVFEIDPAVAEHVYVDIQRTDFVIRVRNRTDLLAFEATNLHSNHGHFYVADVTVSIVVVQSPGRSFYVSVLSLSPRISSLNVSCVVQRTTVTATALNGVDIVDQLDLVLVYTTGSLHGVRIVCEATTMHVHTGATAAFVMLRDVNVSRDVSLEVRSSVASFVLDGQFSLQPSSSGRTGTAVRIVDGSVVEDVNVTVDNVVLDMQLLKPSNGILGSYSFARSSVVFIVSIVSGNRFRIRVLNTSLGVVINDQVRGTSYGLIGTRAFQGSASFILIQLSVVRASTFAVHDAVLRANISIGAPLGFPPPMESLIDTWSAFVGGIVVANVSDCIATMRNVVVHTEHMDVDQGSFTFSDAAVDCSIPLVANLTGLVLALDLVQQITACAGPLIAAVPADLLIPPLQHANFNITLTNATVSLSDGASQAGAAVAGYNPPSSANGVRVTAARVVVARRAFSTSDGEHEDGFQTSALKQLSGFVYVFASTIRGFDATLRDGNGWQALLHRQAFFDASVDDAVVHVANSSFVASPHAPWALSLPLVATANLHIHAEDSAFSGFASLLRANSSVVDGLPAWNPQRPSLLQCGCNRWDGDATTRRFYNRHVLWNLHPARNGLVTDTSGACYEAPTQTIAVVEPAPSRRLRVSVAAASASTAAIAISGITSAVLPGLTSGLSAVRLQTSMRLLRNQQRCAADAVGGGEATAAHGTNGDSGEGGGDEDAYGSYAVDNPTLAVLPGLGTARAHAGGAVLANVALVVVFAVLTSALPRLWERWHDAKEGGMAAVEEEHHFVSRFVELFVHLPGSGTAFYAILLQPLVGCAFLLVVLRGPDRVGGAILGVLGLSFSLGALLLVGVRILRGGFPLVARPISRATHRRSPSSSKHGPPPVRSCHAALSRLVGVVADAAEPRWAWRAPSRASTWESTSAGQHDLAHERQQRSRMLLVRYGPVFDGYRQSFHWYFLVDLCATAVLGLLDALPTVDAGLCDGALYSMFALTVVALVVVAACRPSASPLDNVLVITCAALTAGTAAVVVFVTEGADTAVEVLVLLQSALTVAGQVWALVAFVVRVVRGGVSWWMSASPPHVQNLFTAAGGVRAASSRNRQRPTNASQRPSSSMSRLPHDATLLRPSLTQAQHEALAALLDIACNRNAQLVATF